ncbi:ATP-binding cassette domain-containing protein, partial [Micromonospora sp. DH15]|nr:ATP-binding cassette domain-containing protein [Micromonospora sp. DH15]
MVDRNRAGLLLQPWSVLVPAALLVALAVGVNLVADRLLADRDAAAGEGAARDAGSRHGAAHRDAPGARVPAARAPLDDGAAGPAVAAGPPTPPVDACAVRVVGLDAEVAGRRLLARVSFTVAAGEVLALVGRSGSGKTTAGRALLGEAGPGVRLAGRVEVA